MWPRGKRERERDLRVEEENVPNRNRGRGEKVRSQAGSPARTGKTPAHCSFRDRERKKGEGRERKKIHVRARTNFIIISSEIRSDERKDSTKKTNNSRLISSLVRRSQSLFHGSFCDYGARGLPLRICLALPEDDVLGI